MAPLRFWLGERVVTNVEEPSEVVLVDDVRGLEERATTGRKRVKLKHEAST